MAHPYHQALSSVKKWGGTIEDYLPLHAWFDQSKEILADFRHAIPTILVTAFPNDVEPARALNEGVTCYLRTCANQLTKNISPSAFAQL